MPILVGVDGTRKMSKSLGNQIGILDPPQEMYGKTMAIPDSAMGEYFRLLLGREPPAGIDEGARAARDAKRELARELVAWLHSDEEAREAEAHFERVFVQKENPEEIEEAEFGCDRRQDPPARGDLRAVRHLALGGPPPDRPGRRVARRRRPGRGGARRPLRAGRRPGPEGRPATLRAPAGRGLGLAGRGVRGRCCASRAAWHPHSGIPVEGAPGGQVRRASRYTPGRLKGASGRRVGRSPPWGSPPREARRSLKTQQHAHLRSLRDRGVRPGSTRRRAAFSACSAMAKSQSREVPRHGFGTSVYGSRAAAPAAPSGVKERHAMTAFREVLHGEFDPGSGRTLAACLTHASGATNQGLPWGRAANG